MLVKFLWVYTLILAILAGLVLVFTALSQGAPQQAAGAAVAAGMAVIPYVFTRAAEALANSDTPPEPVRFEGAPRTAHKSLTVESRPDIGSA